MLSGNEPRWASSARMYASENGFDNIFPAGRNEAPSADSSLPSPIRFPQHRVPDMSVMQRMQRNLIIQQAETGLRTQRVWPTLIPAYPFTSERYVMHTREPAPVSALVQTLPSDGTSAGPFASSGPAAAAVLPSTPRRRSMASRAGSALGSMLRGLSRGGRRRAASQARVEPEAPEQPARGPLEAW